MPESLQEPQHGPQAALRVAREDVRFGVAFLRRRWRRLLLAFVGVLLPLWAFGELAEDLHEGEVFFFDAPLLRLAHALAAHGRDEFFVQVSALGYLQGVVPVDVLLLVVLAWRRQVREGLFAGVAIIGSALLNLGAKQLFTRQRPSLWESIAPESTYSFPSGHAMGSMTLGLRTGVAGLEHALALADDRRRRCLRGAGGAVEDLPGRALPVRHPGWLDCGHYLGGGDLPARVPAWPTALAAGSRASVKVMVPRRPGSGPRSWRGTRRCPRRPSATVGYRARA